MSTINVNNLSGRGGATPNLPDGAVISGVATVTNLKPTNVNVSGAVTATTFDGSLKSTGTPTLGLGVTINSSGINVSGVLTATTLYGDGSNLTGVGESIAPWNYNPDINDTSVQVDTGIGITFNKKVLAGSGTATLKVVNAGTAGTTIQSWGISSATFPGSDVTSFSLGSLVSDLLINQTYQLDIPEGFVVSSTGTSYVGTAYTFTVRPAAQLLWAWGYNLNGQLGLNESGSGDRKSSPVQVPGDSWGVWSDDGFNAGQNNYNVTMGGELWGWGDNGNGQLARDQGVQYSSPVKIGNDTNWKSVAASNYYVTAIKTDGTLWAWGYNRYGQLGQNQGPGSSVNSYSSPAQIPGTTWAKVFSGENTSIATKTDGTLWMWGRNNYGQLAQNDEVSRSSPVQVPGTTWRTISGSSAHPGLCHVVATKTDGTLWAWGLNEYGQLSQNNRTHYSSPAQIPGTSWSELAAAGAHVSWIGRTDGTLWAVGHNSGDRRGALGQNSLTTYSSPVQIPGTTWGTNQNHFRAAGTPLAMKTDGTLWSWGYNSSGSIGQNNRTDYSSPVQIGSETDWIAISNAGGAMQGLREDTTP